MLARVIDRKTKIERTITKKAYEIIPQRYDLIEFINEEGKQKPPAMAVKTEVKTEKKSAEVAEVKVKPRKNAKT